MEKEIDGIMYEDGQNMISGDTEYKINFINCVELTDMTTGKKQILNWINKDILKNMKPVEESEQKGLFDE